MINTTFPRGTQNFFVRTQHRWPGPEQSVNREPNINSRLPPESTMIVQRMEGSVAARRGPGEGRSLGGEDLLRPRRAKLLAEVIV